MAELSEKTKKEKILKNHVMRENIDDPEEDCIALEVECLPFQSNISVHNLIRHENMKQNQTKFTNSSVAWPWTAMIFIDGKLGAIGVLMNKNWLLINKNSIADSERLLDNSNVIAVLGNPNVQMNVQSSHEELRRIDCIRHLNNTNSLLFHMSVPIEFNRYILPSFAPNETIKDRHCIAMTLDSKRDFLKVSLKVNDCPRNNCYEIHENMKSKFNCSTAPETMPAIIMCRGNTTGWFTKGMTRKNICEFKSEIHVRTINSTELQHAFGECTI